ncbi:MAG: hypothetical protein M1835_007575 [Candelina submexicana]|nr:MAG: hypothetical protein M1835_007575 [Candelina submexicana]
MVATAETHLYRKDVHKKGQHLTVQDREKLVKPYLPSPQPTSPNRASTRRRKSLRDFLKTQLHILVFVIIHALFSIYIRLRQAYHAVIDRILAILYYHHRTPELIRKDVKALSRLPQHLSIILEVKDEVKGGQSLKGLMDQLSEVSAWCICVGIPFLSVYERSGILKSYIPKTHRRISKRLYSYFGRNRPTLQMRAPHMPSFLDGDTTPSSAFPSQTTPGHLSILLLSSEDGRSTLVDLTKTLTEMSQRGKLSPSDISVELVDAEISESVMGEPDLLLLFGPEVELASYPPWQLRLTEILYVTFRVFPSLFWATVDCATLCSHVQDNMDVGYQVFLRALHRYAKAQMRFGR